MNHDPIPTHDVIILGEGAAGLMCAIEAGRRGRKVLLLEHQARAGSKILISGGGRCNFTNREANATNYHSQNPHFCKSALSQFTSEDFIQRIQEQGIAFHEKKLGQLFCDTSSKEILNFLLKEIRKADTELLLSTTVLSVKKSDQGFTLETSRGSFLSGSLVVATGGLSFPKLGASDLGYQIARQFHLKTAPATPALDGFILPDSLQKKLSNLAGISVDSKVHCNGISFRENLLFTHQGLSGPAILQSSLYWNPNETVTIDFLPDYDLEAKLMLLKREGAKQEVKNWLASLLPKKLAEVWVELYLKEVKTPLSQIADRSLENFSSSLKHWEFVPQSTVGYSKAEVTRGGVSTDELSSKTMECKKVPGLYFIGEVVDVTGWLGGYNFQWAWSSGWVAGQSA